MPARRTVTAALFTKILKNLNACSPALDFVRGKSFATAWRTQKHNDWLEWLIDEIGDQFTTTDEQGHVRSDDLSTYDMTHSSTVEYPNDTDYPNDTQRAKQMKVYNKAELDSARAAYDVLEPFVEAYLLDYADKMDGEVGGWTKGKNREQTNNW